jgi:hypothetical protein
MPIMRGRGCRAAKVRQQGNNGGLGEGRPLR